MHYMVEASHTPVSIDDINEVKIEQPKSKNIIEIRC